MYGFMYAQVVKCITHIWLVDMYKPTQNTSMYKHVHTLIHMCMHARTCAGMYVGMHARARTHAHILTHAHLRIDTYDE